MSVTTLRVTRGTIENGGPGSEVVVIPSPPNRTVRTMTFVRVRNSGTVPREVTAQIRDRTRQKELEDGVEPIRTFVVPAGRTYVLGSESLSSTTEQLEIVATDDQVDPPLTFRGSFYDQPQANP